MKLYLKNITFLSSILGCSIMFEASSALAVCIAGDCAGLGYTKSASDCSGVDAIRCPFNTSKYFCVAQITLDDSCPTGYSKATCTASQTLVDTQKTEAGTYCYKCQATTDCSTYTKNPWAKYGSSMPQTCASYKYNGNGMVPSPITETCGGTQYVKCAVFNENTCYHSAELIARALQNDSRCAISVSGINCIVITGDSSCAYKYSGFPQ